MEQLGLERLSIVVHDWGAVGLALAQEAPELIERLVIVDAVPLLPGYRWHPVARVWRRPVLGELFMGLNTRWGSRQLMRRLRAVPEEAIDAWLDTTWPHFDHGTQRAILRLYRSAPPDVLERAGERLGELRCPALVLWGEHGKSHWPWLDDPRVVDTVADFLTSAG